MASDDAKSNADDSPQNKPSRQRSDGNPAEPQQLRNCLAKALYDNIAEAPDELAFRKGDILTVLEQNTNSLEGWWLCSLRGRQGIVPGNRLRLLPGMYDASGLGSVSPSTTENSLAMRRNWNSNPNKVVTPQKIGDVYLYDIPVSGKKDERSDSPRSSVSSSSQQPHSCNTSIDGHGGSYDTPPCPRVIRQDAYDEPRSHLLCSSPQLTSTTYDIPKYSSSIPGFDVHIANDYDIPCAEQLCMYDTPRSTEKETLPNMSHIVISDTYDFPQTTHKSSPPIYDGRAFSRSSGDTSTSSSFRSLSGSHSSMDTLSLSSVSGSNRSSLEQHSSDLYDIPPEPQPVNESRMAHPIRNTFTAVPYQSTYPQETYDVPTNNMPAQLYDTPSAQPIRVEISDSTHNVPFSATKGCLLPRNSVGGPSNMISCGEIDKPGNKNSGNTSEYGELTLDLNVAVERLVNYQYEVQGAISKLFSFVGTNWRQPECMETKAYDIDLTCHRILSTLADFYNFAQGALANSAHSTDKTLSLKLSKLVRPLGDSLNMLKNCIRSLDEKGWHVECLSITGETNAPDELDQLVACVRNLVEDVRQISSFIQGNSSLLFKCQDPSNRLGANVKPPVAPKPDLKKPELGQKVQERPLPPTPSGLIKSKLSCKEYYNEYDYVNLESKESAERENEAIKAALPKDMCQSFDELIKQSETPVVTHETEIPTTVATMPTPIVQKDFQVLHFYAAQIDTHINHLTNAIDAFLVTIKNNQPPKVFLGHSKFIVIGAHKLVYIGDTVYRNICSTELKNRILQNTNSLCDSLKTLVANTRKAASEFPSVVAVQTMVDSVVDVSHLANDLKVLIFQVGKA